MDDLEEEESLTQLLSELETLAQSTPNSPLPETLILSLQSISADDDAVAVLFRRLPSPSNSLLPPLSAAMADSPPPLSLLASKVYLSLLLSPSSPLYTLFTPLSFLSLLRSLRRSLKSPTSNSPPSNPAPKKRRKRKPADKFSDSGNGQQIEPVLDLLHSVLGKVRLDAAHDGRKSLIETLAAVLDAVGTHRVSDLCFRILHSIVSSPEHGDQLTSAVELFVSLAPAILSGKSKASVLGFLVRKIIPLGRESEGIKKAICYLPRYLVAKAPERSEPRAAAVESIVEVVRAMEEEDRIGFVGYAAKMAQGKGNLRLLAVDIFLALLTSLPDPLADRLGAKCLEALLDRCSDSMGGIRARSLTNLAQAIAFISADASNSAQLREIVDFGGPRFRELLRTRCTDEKAAVRKAALLLITKSMALIGGPIDHVLLKTMGSACSDPLVSIRKAALTALSEVYRSFPDDKIISEWLHAVPPLIVDNETSIQEECQNLFLELVLDRICRAGKVNLGSEATDLELLLPEGILDLLKGLCDGEVAPCVKKICVSLGRKGKLKPSIASSLQSVISTSETLWQMNSMPIEKWTAPFGAWQLLSEVSLFTPKAVGWKFLHHHWKLLDQSNREEEEIFDNEEPESISWAGDRVSLLQTICNVSVELPPLPASELADNLLQRIEHFNMHLSEVDAHVKALKTLCKRKTESSEEGDHLVLTWAQQLLLKAFTILDNYVKAMPESDKVKSYITPRSRKGKGKGEASASKSMQEAVTAVFTIGSLVLVCPSADFQQITPLLHTIITSGSSEPKPRKLAVLKVSVKDMAPSLYIQSWVTMGKICLADGKLAKRYIPLFIQELEKSDYAALRNNIMIMMTDFCVRYTALIDCYISRITISLCDPCEVVRRQTFILLSRLLQRDYVKWKGVLFLRFLLSLVDESEKIRHLADFLFGNILKVKAPLLAYNSFIEAIFVLNACNAHSGHSETQEGSHTGGRCFSIRGTDEKSRSKRMHIYVSLLKQMAPEHLLATSAKLCVEILAAASDGFLSIDDATGQSVLQDALQILACKEMRIHQNSSSEASEMDDEGGESGGALQAARGRIVTHVAKKNLIQNAVPIFIEFKRLLESKNSPLIGSLMDCLRALLKDYKNEFDEILVADKQLQKELIYDMNKYETTKAKSTVAEAIASTQKSAADAATINGFRSPVYARVSEKLGSGGKIRSAVAEAAARATARSVLREVNTNAVATPPLGSMSVPKLKSRMGCSNIAHGGERPADVLESLRRRL